MEMVKGGSSGEKEKAADLLATLAAGCEQRACRGDAENM